MGDQAAGVTGRAQNVTEYVSMWGKGVREGIVNRITPTTKNILYTAIHYVQLHFNYTNVFYKVFYWRVLTCRILV